MNKILIATLLAAMATTAFADQEQSSEQYQGQIADSRSESTARAYGGDGGKGGKGGKGGSSDSSSSTDSDISINTGDTDSASSAASVVTAACQTGTSGQTVEGGLAIVGSDQICDYWKAAMMAREAHMLADKHGDAEAAAHWDEMYTWNLNAAQELLENTEHTSLLQRIADQLFKPLALLGLLVYFI
jgi:hypothetical protein